MGTIASQITSLTIVYSTVYSGADQSKHQSSASLAFVRGIHRGPVNSPHKLPVTRKMFPFDDVIMVNLQQWTENRYLVSHQVYWGDLRILGCDVCLSKYGERVSDIINLTEYIKRTWQSMPLFHDLTINNIQISKTCKWLRLCKFTRVHVEQGTHV